MRLRISLGLRRIVAVTACVCLVGLLGPAAVPADELLTVKLTDAQLKAMTNAPIGHPNGGNTHPKVANALMEVFEFMRIRGDWRGEAEARGILVDGDTVLVEIRLNPASPRSASWYVEKLGARIRHHNVPSLMEVWLPVDQIEKSAEHTDVHLVRPARLVRPTVGNTTSEGVAVLNVNTTSVAYDYHDLGADGSGVTVADIDAGFNNYASLQTSGDWPQPSNLRRFLVSSSSITDCDVSACGAGYEASNHGAATVEIVYDLAPGAEYLTYATTTVGDWYAALVDAANRGAHVITESLSAPLDGIGDGTECPPIWGSPCGSIAEAAAYARAQGSLVVNSAANYGTEHWGGTYVDTGSGMLDWGAGGNLNVGTYCYPNGYPMSVDLFWDDWTAPVDHNYDLRLYEYRGSSWLLQASSTNLQNGDAGQAPQEAIRYTVSGAIGGLGCSPGSGAFGILVLRTSAATNRHLQVFANDWGSLSHIMEDRSLGFPADSPHVYTVGAVDVAAPGTLESYSSEGPALGPGGSAAPPSPPNPKPDGVSAAQVSTEAYGPSGFAGTSASAPHVAGVAAVLTQLRNEKYATPPAMGNPDGIQDLLSTFALEDPTFSAVHTSDRGNGLVALRFCNQSVAVNNAEWAMVGLPCNRRSSSSVSEVLGDDLDLTNVYWEVWDWNATTGSYRQLFEADQMVPGVGYWLLYEGNATVGIQGLVQDRSEPYFINLVGEVSALGRPNFVGHGFSFDVPWPDVNVFYGGAEHNLQEAFDDGVLRNFLWKPYTPTGYAQFDGLLGEGTLSSFDGFWIKAWQDAELRIPTSLAAESAERESTVGGNVGWSVRLEASSNQTTASARIGQLADSHEGWDVHDAELMPSFETHQFYVVLPHPEWGEYAGDYVRDYHGHVRTDEWRFEVTSNEEASVELRCDGPRAVLEQSFVIDIETGEAIPASALGKGYEFKMQPGARAFLWRVR